MRNRTQKPPKNLRARHYDRVIMPREVEQWKKFCAACGLVFVILLVIGVALSLSGCAAKKPVKSQHQAAQFEIPRECATGFQWTKKTVCKAVANDPEHAVCSNVAVRYWCVTPQQR